MPTVIAPDAMGSDKAPKPEIEGALQAARHHGVRVLLVGPETRLRAELARYPGARRLGVEIVQASEVIGMEEKVAGGSGQARFVDARGTAAGARRVRGGIYDGGQYGRGHGDGEDGAGHFAGRGSSGAGGGVADSTEHACLLLDVGANVDCKPKNLEQFAVMGEIYCRSIFEVEHPRVGLLSIGEEEGKGNELTRESVSAAKAACRLILSATWKAAIYITARPM